MSAKAKNILVWILIFMALAMFWVSIRSQTDQILYSAIALGIWGLSFAANKYIRTTDED